MAKRKLNKDSLALLVVLLFISSDSLSQFRNKDLPDTLLAKDYIFFKEKLASDDHDEATARIYSTAYLAKAKSEQNWKEMVNAYKSILHQSVKELHPIYADSMIYAARQTADKQLVASAFVTKGIILYNLKDHTKALDHFLIANSFLQKTDDPYLIHKVKFNIAKIKYFLGFYDEAIPLFRECIDFFKAQEEMPYLVSIHHLSLCYIKIGEYDLCAATNQLGIREAFRIELPEAVNHFVHAEGINQYHLKNYGIAIIKLQQALPGIIENSDFTNEIVAYFYIAKSYWGLRQYSMALPYLKRVDKAFQDKQFIQPDLRQNYELLIDYFRSLNNVEMELFYIKRLMAADRVMEKNFKYLSAKIHKEYDTQELREAKEAAERSMRKERNMKILAYIVIVLLLVLVAYLTVKFFEKRSYRKKYKEYLSKKTKPKAVYSREVANPVPLDIRPEVINAILDKMEKFEQEHGYLEKGLKQEKLATIFESNPKYISKVINYHRNKKSNEYINDLRIDYILERLENERIYRLYDIQSLGEEAGFSTTQHFTRAFLARTGMAASFFLKKLKTESPAPDIKE